MDIERLRELDEQADETIAKWSLAALGANLLPPPFDMIAVGLVFAALGRRLASQYGVAINLISLRDLGIAMAQGVSAVLVGYLAAGILKYIPGVNIWIALLAQPPIVGAVSFAVGHAFKQYYHAILIEGRALTPTEMRDLANKALSEKLNVLRAAGYRFSPPAIVISKDDGPFDSATPLESRVYSDRQLVVLVDSKSKRKNQYPPGKLEQLGENLSPLRFVAREDLSSLNFPPGHSRPFVVYAGHPLKPMTYYAAADFHRRVFEDKVIELSRILRYLGAKRFTIERTEGYAVEGRLTAMIGAVSVHRKASRSVSYEANFKVANQPHLPDELSWYYVEPYWQEIADGRLVHNTQAFELKFEYSDDYGINVNLDRSIGKLKFASLGGNFTKFQKTTWHVAGEFGGPDQS